MVDSAPFRLADLSSGVGTIIVLIMLGVVFMILWQVAILVGTTLSSRSAELGEAGVDPADL